MIKKSIGELKQRIPPLPSFFTDEDPFSAIAQSYLAALLVPDREKARKIISDALASGKTVPDIYLRVFQPVLRETGRLWQIHKLSIAKEHFVTASVQLSITRLHYQVISSRKGELRGKTIVTACVGEELHDVGIRMVTDFFEIDGWNTYHIGANIPAQSLIEAVKDRNPEVLAISLTIPTYIPVVHYLIRSLRADPKTAKVKILVGGYVFNVVPDLWKQIGADAYAADAGEAVVAANRFVEGKN